ncbi:hypothetical protein BGZ76_002493, partial [Entomortierella beljakovae]
MDEELTWDQSRIPAPTSSILMNSTSSNIEELSHMSQSSAPSQRLKRRFSTSNNLFEQLPTYNKKTSHSAHISSFSSQNDCSPPHMAHIQPRDFNISLSQPINTTQNPFHYGPQQSHMYESSRQNMGDAIPVDMHQSKNPNSQHHFIDASMTFAQCMAAEDSPPLTRYPCQSLYSHPQPPTSNIMHSTRMITDYQNGYPDFAQVRNALAKQYKKDLVIQRVSGKTIRLEKCYIGLTIVNARNQRHIDKEQLTAQENSFVRVESYEKLVRANTVSTMSIEDLFNKQRLRNGNEDIPKRILIHGRAGIGKTTLCKKLVHLFINGKWSDQFEAVLWIPLCQLRSYEPCSIEDLIQDKHLVHCLNEKSLLTYNLVTGIQQHKVLFILDGFDEILYDIDAIPRMKSFIDFLLGQMHIIVTSRPSGINTLMSKEFDLEVETVGFNSKGIGDYVNNVLDRESADSVLTFIKQTPIIQSLANIPFQLDVICSIWKSLPTDTKSITITKLYQGMISWIWRKDGIRLDKSKIIGVNKMAVVPDYRLNSLMSNEIEFLSFLAFKGMKSKEIVFDQVTLDSIVEEIDKQRKTQNKDELPFDFLSVMKQTSFLHSLDTDLETKSVHQSWHFIHLTFQEYFAASWLSKCIHKQLSPLPSQQSSIEWEETKAFIEQNKYDPQHEIVWRMLAGQLDGRGLEIFFEILQSEPIDLIGVRHAILLAGCYRESSHNLSKQLMQVIEHEILRIICIDNTLQQPQFNSSILGGHQMIPEKIPKNGKWQSKIEEDYIDLAISVHQCISPDNSTIMDHSDKLQHREDYQSVRSKAVRVLEMQSTLSPSVIQSLVEYLKEGHENVRLSAASALGKPLPSVIQCHAKNVNMDVRLWALDALECQSTLPPSIIKSLVDAPNDENDYVRSSGSRELGNQSRLPLSAIQSLDDALKDGNEDFSSLVTKALGACPCPIWCSMYCCPKWAMWPLHGNEVYTMERPHSPLWAA